MALTDLLPKRTVLQEFKEFALKGNVVDLAVGIIIGAAFVKIVQSLVNDVILPPIGAVIGKIDFNNMLWVLSPPKDLTKLKGTTPADYATAGGVTLNYGAFINNIIQFVFVAFAVFLMVKTINRLRERAAAGEPTPDPTTKPCPFCLSDIPVAATKCAHCTSEVTGG